MSTILVTGGAGYIGSHTVIELMKKGHKVVIVDNLSNSKFEAVKRVEQIVGESIPFIKADILDKDAMRKVFTDYSIDAVINFAGFKAVGESVAKPIEYYRNNIDCTLTVCESMKRNGVKRFIFSSSATVYGIPDHVPLDESMPTSCTNPYGWTKYMNEQILTDIAKAIVDQPESVTVAEDANGNNVVLTLSVAEPDMGKVIGRNGRGKLLKRPSEKSSSKSQKYGLHEQSAVVW